MPSSRQIKSNFMFQQYLCSKSTYTHLLLNGGKLNVPDARHGAFLNTYASAVSKREPVYVVESKTRVFRLFVDFDFQPPAPDDDSITAAIQSMATVAGYYFDTTSDAVVLRKDIETGGKVGIHMTWDTIYVTPLVAKAFRLHVLQKLERASPEIDWASIVDVAVYGGSGLRMPWSQKKNAPGVYVPIFVIDHHGTMTPVSTPETVLDIQRWVHRCCIRTPEAQPTGTCIVTADAASDTRATTSTGGPVAEHLAEYTEALDLIQQILPEAYADQRFTSMHRYGDHCIVLRSSSRRCGNKGYDHHASSTVYFVVLRRKGIGYQRCFSRKDMVREGQVTCTDYVGPPFTIPERALSLLWPPETTATPAAHSKVRLKRTMDLLNKTRPAVRIKKKSR